MLKRRWCIFPLPLRERATRAKRERGEGVRGSNFFDPQTRTGPSPCPLPQGERGASDHPQFRSYRANSRCAGEASRLPLTPRTAMPIGFEQ